jgi:hypothetical protein
MNCSTVILLFLSICALPIFGQVRQQRNVLGGPLQLCSLSPLTGWTRHVQIVNPVSELLSKQCSNGKIIDSDVSLYNNRTFYALLAQLNLTF